MKEYKKSIHNVFKYTQNGFNWTYEGNLSEMYWKYVQASHGLGHKTTTSGKGLEQTYQTKKKHSVE